MINKPKILALIPARGGSKGLPRKNILTARGKPLIAWTIEAAHKSAHISKVILSSDDDEIIETAKLYNCEVPFKRPSALAFDTTSAAEVVLHALEAFPEYDYIVLLQPTSPLRTAIDIDRAFELMHETSAHSCVSVTPSSESPYWMFKLSENQRLIKLLDGDDYTRRQELPPAYILNGAIYISSTKRFRETNSFLDKATIAYIMPQNRSLDIDTEEDLNFFNNIQFLQNEQA